MYIDTHCHLQLEQFQNDRNEVLTNAIAQNVRMCIVPGVNLLSSRLAIELADANRGTVFASVGFHPYEAAYSPDIRDIERLLQGKNADGVVAIGECGLDYHLYKGEPALGKKQQQRALFAEHLHLAAKYNLPVIMHCRNAFDDFFSVLEEGPSVRGVIHCFSGGLQEMREAKRHNLFLGIDGNITYSKQLAAIVASIPLSMIVLETDAPYLTPVPHRGTRNEPQYIPLIAAKIADVLGKQQTDIENTTTQSAQSLFGLPVI